MNSLKAKRCFLEGNEPKTKKLILYPEDFYRTHIWQDICDCLEVSYNSAEVHIEFVNAKNNEND